MRSSSVIVVCGGLALVSFARRAHAADEPPPATSSGTTQQPAQEAPVESDLSGTPERKFIEKWNRFDFRWFTLKYGIYTIDDAGTSIQGDKAEQQVEVNRDFKVRDFRFTFSGKLATERSITYTMGLMYDGPSGTWFPRETGVQIAIPELWGNIFIGRQKEGISLNKITIGYAVWTMERMPMSEAAIPIMADGLKWLGGTPDKRANWNIAFFHNTLKKNPSFNYYTNTFVARVAVLPLHPDHEGQLLHLGAAYHYGQYKDGTAQLRSRPESFTAPYFVDTGEFPADHNSMVGFEAYYRNANWLAGAEYLLNFVRSEETNNPLFHGGEAFVAWTVTGEVRPYLDVGGKLGFIKPNHSAFSGGSGALETVLHFSYTDLDSGPVQGGRFWRITPQANWYVDDMVSLRVNYGLGHLDRFGYGAFTHFFQARLQLQIE